MIKFIEVYGIDNIDYRNTTNHLINVNNIIRVVDQRTPDGSLYCTITLKNDISITTEESYDQVMNKIKYAQAI